MGTNNFKKIFTLTLLIAIVSVLAGCDMADIDETDIIDEPDDYVEAEGVLLKGTLSESEMQAQSDSNSEVGTVMLVYRKGYEIFEVVDEEFAIDMVEEEPAGISFLDKDDNYLGYLTLGDGLDSIPPQFIDEETEVIDFGEISFDGNEATPEFNPVGEEIRIDEQQKGLLKNANSFFAAVLRSPDIIELLVSDDDVHWFELTLNYHYEHFHLWEWEDSQTITFEDVFGKKHLDYDTTYPFFQLHRFGLSIADLYVHGDDVKLIYPERWGIEDNPQLVDETSDYYHHFDGISFQTIHDLTGIYSSHPAGGEYQLILGDKLDINFHLPENIYEIAKEHAFIAVPTIHLTQDEDGVDLIDRISWRYLTKDEEEIDHSTAAEIVSDGDEKAGFHLSINAYRPEDGEEIGKDIYLDVNEHSYELEKDIAWDPPEDSNYKEFGSIGIGFEDIYGINYYGGFANFDWDNHSPERPEDDPDEYSATILIEDEDNNPIDNATVKVDSKEKETDSSGLVEFDSLVSRIYDIEVHKDGYMMLDDTLEIEDQDKYKEITLKELAEFNVENLNSDFQFRGLDKGGYVKADIVNNSDSKTAQNIYLNIYHTETEQLIADDVKEDFSIEADETKTIELNYGREDIESTELEPGKYRVEVVSDYGELAYTEFDFDHDFEMLVESQEELNELLNTLLPEDNATIYLADGSYDGGTINEEIEFNQLNLKAEEKHNAEIKSTVVIDNASNVLISGLLIEEIEENGIQVGENSDDILIENNYIKNNDYFGIVVNQNSDVKITGNEFDNNGLAEGYPSIHFNNSEGIVKDNLIKNNPVDGIRIRDNSNVSFEQNTIIDNNNDGINVQNSNIDFRDNQVINNSNRGVSIHGESEALLTENLIKDHPYQGIGIDNSRAEIKHNQIEDNEHGLVYSNLIPDYDYEIFENQFIDNDFDVIDFMKTYEEEPANGENKPELLEIILEDNEFEEDANIYLQEFETDENESIWSWTIQTDN